VASYSCSTCRGTSTFAATCCGKPMGSLSAANGSALAVYLATGGAQAARAAAKGTRGAARRAS
jgi:hypothetical protein